VNLTVTVKQGSTQVEIYGQSYHVRGEGDPEYLLELARFVDVKMREIASQSAPTDPMRIAILAALNIADEFTRFREQKERATGLWMERTEELVERLGKTLTEPSKSSPS